MQTGWIHRAGPYKVEHLELPHPDAAVDVKAPAKGCLHTIEGSLESGLAVFQHHFAPTFTVGVDRKGRVRIIQHMPLGCMAAALEHTVAAQGTNSLVRVQIEIAGFSKKTKWLPDPKTTDALAHLLAALQPTVPLKHFSTPSRNWNTWRSKRGWCGHQDVPQNEHWDPGELNWSALLNRAGQLHKHKVVVKPKKRHRLLQPRTVMLARSASIPRMV